MAFSATDAALEGFRIARERPMTMLSWAAASLVISVLTALGTVLLFGDSMAAMMAMSNRTSADPTQSMALMAQLGVFYLFLMPIALLIFSVFTGAVYRAVLQPADSRLAYLRLGADEMRLAVVLVVLFVLSMVVTLAASILFAIIGVMVGVGLVALMGGDPGVGGAIGAVMLMLLLYAVMIFISLAFWTRFSLAGPMTFAEKRILIFESWTATKGRFWPLFGCYLLAGLLGLVVSILGMAISFAVMASLGGLAGNAGGFLGMMEALQPNYESLATYFTAAMIANLVITSVFSSLTYAIFLAPPAVVYRDLIQNKG